MKIKKYQVDAFAEKTFEGNPAVVCPLPQFLPEKMMQQIAMEHNLSETAFIVQDGDRYHIRWFTPVAEVELCGHATLASAYVIFEIFEHPSLEIEFQSLHRGILTVTKVNEMYELDFPAFETDPSKLNKSDLGSCLGVDIVEVRNGVTDCLVVVESESAVVAAKPDFTALTSFQRRGFIITAPSEKYDFVSRFFAPRFGVNEDPVTGSAHTLLIPYWHKKLGKTNLVARQLSSRGGTLYCTYLGDRVRIAGYASLYSEGVIFL